MRKTLLTASVASIFTVFLLLTACDRQVYDDLSVCNNGVYIHLFEQTECAATPSYPSTQVLNIYAFDEQNVLVSSERVEKPALSAEYKYLYKLPKEGLYSFIVWANDEAVFEKESLTPGTTTKTALLQHLKSVGKKEQHQAIDLSTSQPVYVALTEKVAVKTGKDYAETKANLTRLSNHINVRVEGVPDPEQYQIRYSAANGTYLLNGFVATEPIYEYPARMSYPEDEVAMADFYTLKLLTGRNNRLTLIHKETGKTVYDEDLIGTILLSIHASNINLRCTHDFEVVLKMHKCVCPEQPDQDGTYMVAQLYVNKWLIHSYDINLDQL